MKKDLNFLEKQFFSNINERAAKTNIRRINIKNDKNSNIINKVFNTK